VYQEHYFMFKRDAEKFPYSDRNLGWLRPGNLGFHDISYWNYYPVVQYLRRWWRIFPHWETHFITRQIILFSLDWLCKSIMNQSWSLWRALHLLSLLGTSVSLDCYFLHISSQYIHIQEPLFFKSLCPLSSVRSFIFLNGNSPNQYIAFLYFFIVSLLLLEGMLYEG
jgi:hypothetical protein